jgi:transcriptional regulator with XRE-family HTH domain
MQWKDVQRRYRQLFAEAKRTRGTTQVKIAQSVGLTQADVSRLMNMEGDDGPQVATLLKAIDGLGISVSSFFEQIERQTAGDLPARAGVSTTAPTPRGQAADHAEGRSVSAPPDTMLVRTEDIYKLGRTLGRALKDAVLDQPAANSRARKPSRRRRSPRND